MRVADAGRLPGRAAAWSGRSSRRARCGHPVENVPARLAPRIAGQRPAPLCQRGHRMCGPSHPRPARPDLLRRAAGDNTVQARRRATQGDSPQTQPPRARRAPADPPAQGDDHRPHEGADRPPGSGRAALRAGGSAHGTATLDLRRRRGGVVTQRPAKPCTPVRFRSAPSPEPLLIGGFGRSLVHQPGWSCRECWRGTRQKGAPPVGLRQEITSLRVGGASFGRTARPGFRPAARRDARSHSIRFPRGDRRCRASAALAARGGWAVRAVEGDGETGEGIWTGPIASDQVMPDDWSNDAPLSLMS
jgi:hypothetical protein